MIRNIQDVEDDIVTMKRLIKQKLIEDPDILEILNNQNLDLDNTDEFFDNHIYGFIRVPKIQDVVSSYICFTVDDIEENRWNEVMKKQYIQFHAICHLDVMKTEYSIDRHDLLGYLIRDIFNWSNIFGLQFKLVENKERAVDGDYYCRTLVFEATKPNSLNKARMDGKYDKLGHR